MSNIRPVREPTEHRPGRICLTDDPMMLLRQRNAARSALADVLRATYDDDLPDHIADNLRAIVWRGVNVS
jgi:hypothetical protein